MAVELSKDRFCIANDFVRKVFTVEKGRLASLTLTDVLTGKTPVTADGNGLFALHFAGAFGGAWVRSGELKVQDALPGEDASAMSLKIFFKPFRIHGCRIELQYVETLGRMDSFCGGHLELLCEGGEKAILDFIDFAPLAVEDSAVLQSVKLPEKRKDALSPALLGQPVLLKNAFCACTFPAAVNAVCGGYLQARRYYGRSLAALCGGEGKFVSDRCVWGAAPAQTAAAVRAAFFRCLEKTLPPVGAQHTLCFPDLPLGEEAETVLFSLEKQMQQEAGRFFDCVLLEKGQIYPDEAPFDFPTELPQSLRSFAAAAAALGAPLGMTVGTPPKKSRRFHKRKQTDVCLADPEVLAAFQSFVREHAEKCGVTHWNLLLPTDKPCKEKTHAHPVGGEGQLWYFSDLTEKWINCLCMLQRGAKRRLHFSLSGLSLSPWLLQWADFLVLMRQKDAPPSGCSAADAALFDANAAGICVPPERLSLPDAACETPPFPYTGALRTLTAMQETTDLRLLSRLWKTGDALRALLCRTVLFGEDPHGGGCFGFAAFHSGEGLLTLCNPSGEPKDMTVTLDEALGVPKRFLCVGVCRLLDQPQPLCADALRYGDHLTQTLAPYETLVLHFGRRPTAPEILAVEALNSRTLRLRFDQPVDVAAAQCAENPVQSAESAAQGFEATLTFAYPFRLHNRLELTGVRDLFGNESSVCAAFAFSENGLLPPGALFGTGAFSIKVTFGSEAQLAMYLQTERLQLLAEDGHITFRVGNAVLRSRRRTDDIVQVCAVREPGGALKLYLNGRLDNTLLPTAPPAALQPAAPLCFDEKRTKLYARALAFDEV